MLRSLPREGRQLAKAKRKLSLWGVVCIDVWPLMIAAWLTVTLAKLQIRPVTEQLDSEALSQIQAYYSDATGYLSSGVPSAAILASMDRKVCSSLDDTLSSCLFERPAARQKASAGFGSLSFTVKGRSKLLLLQDHRSLS